MALIDIFQTTVALSALGLQLWATALSKPLKAITPLSVWHALVCLNLFVMLRRMLSVLEIVFGWAGQSYDTTAVLIGLCVSLSMMTTIVRLRLHLDNERANELALRAETKAERERVREMAEAALEMAEELKRRNYRVEDSDAYKLALKFADKQQ